MTQKDSHGSLLEHNIWAIKLAPKPNAAVYRDQPLETDGQVTQSTDPEWQEQVAMLFVSTAREHKRRYLIQQK